MTVTISLSTGSADGGLRSSDSASYANAIAGSVIIGGSGGSSGGWGGWLTGGVYNAYETFLSFSFTPPTSAERIVSAALRLACTETYTTSISRELQAYEYDFGASVDTSDWRNTAWFAANLKLIEITDAQNAPAGQYIEGGSGDFTDRVAASSPLRLVIVSSRSVGGYSPTGNEFSAVALGNASGTSADPAIVWTTVPASTHVHTSGAQVRLSGGTWAYLESDGAATPAVNLRHRTVAGVASTISSVPVGSSSTDFRLIGGMRTLALVADSSDNLYIIGPKGDSLGAQILIKPYRKNSGASWTALTARSYSTLAFDRDGVKGVSAAWHNAGTSGTIVALTVRGHGDWTQYPANDAMYALINCEHLLTGVGSTLRGSGSAVGTLLSLASDPSRLSTPANETASGIEVQAPSPAALRGYVFCLSGNASPGELAYHPSARYILASDGTSLTANLASSYPVRTVKDPNSRVRVLAISETVHVAVSMDSTSTYGPSFTVLQNTGSSSSFTRLAYVKLDGRGIASLPSASTLSTTSAWDVAYDPTDGKVWLYYIDTANARRIMRTSIDLNTYQASLDEIEVEAALGSGAASVAKSIRVDRNARSGDDSILVSVAVETSGVLSNSYYVDSFNLAPNAPILTPKANFDATAAATFEWTFSDPNSLDTQSAFELDINTSAGVNVFSTGQLGGTVTYVGVGTGATADNASLTPALPSSWADGDVFILFAAIRSTSATVNTPTGWTQLGTVGNAGVFGRTARTGDTAPTVSFTGGSAGDDTIAQIAAFRGFDQDMATITHAQTTQINASAQNIATPALAAPTLDNCVAVYYGWKQDNWTGSTAPAGTTKIDGTTSALGSDAGIVWAYTIQTAATAVSASSFTITGGAAAISRSRVAFGRPHQDPEAGSYTLPANIIANGASYQWRVRTWDDGGEVGPWSDYLTFQTSASGTVTITDPAVDNPAGVITDDYTIAWTVAGTTQAAYRVIVTRVDDSTTLVDTGWVTGTDTTYTVSGMLPDVQYQVSVTVRNAGLVESGTATRLIMPSYSGPETPTVTVVDGGGYLLVAINNPESGSTELGTVADGFETGVSGYTVTNGTFTATSAQAYSGSWSALLTATSASIATTVKPNSTRLVAVTGGERYSVGYQAYAAASASNLADSIWWYSATSAALSSTSAAAALPASAWSTRLYTATAPASAAYAVAGCLLTSPSAGQAVYVDNLILTIASDRPAATGNQLHRRRADGTGVTILVADEGDVPADGTWRDYTAAAGVGYEYRARAVAATGYTDSAWTDGILTLQGVWIHDPLDPEGSVTQYPYGRSNRSESISVAESELQFAGRTYPVVEFGEQQDDTWSIRVTIPHGPTWAADVDALRAFVQSRRTLCLRDNRGRFAYCVLSGYRGDDRDEGTEVSITARRVDWTEVTV